MFGQKEAEQAAAEQVRQRRTPIPPLREFEVTRYKPGSDETVLERVRVQCHNLEYPAKDLLVAHVAVEFREAQVVQVRRIFNGYIDAIEINPMVEAEATLTPISRILG